MNKIKEKFKITIYEDNTAIIEKNGERLRWVTSFRLEQKALEPVTFTVTQDLI